MTKETSTTAAAPAELPMEEYAAAVLRGGNPVKTVTPAAASETKAQDDSTDGQVDQAAASSDANEDAGNPPTVSVTEEDLESQIEEAHPAKKGIQKRFSEMTAKQKELQAKADAATQEAAAAKAEVEKLRADAERARADAEKALAAVPVVKPEAEDPAPQRVDYDDPDEFTAAISAHATRQEIRKSSQAAQEAAQARAAEAKKTADAAQQAETQKSIDALHATFQKRQAEVKPEYPDYDEKVTNNTELVMRNDIFFAIEKAADAPHLLYHIASNPEECASLNKMSQMDAAMRLGELTAELRLARKPKVTKAAEPIKPVSSRQSPQPKSPHDETMEEYAARRESELKASANKRTRVI